ncbi:unnamed protein product [Thelazia callipaeda]|uniref:ShKT domain-containing protein n=1 Tax=Thelazia callipaeda TaxID=103827 RepID=A0A3P7K2R5_THECL|nr:unnamed protein product [Thelazia callipaeda]
MTACIGGICPPGFLCINGSCLNLNVPTTTRGTVTSSTTTTTTSPACVDLSAPGRPSDCPLRANLCNDPLYFNLMTVQCPRTCNRCGGQNQNSITSCCTKYQKMLDSDKLFRCCGNYHFWQIIFEKLTNTFLACVDRVGSSGTSNCASVAYLCRDPLYLSLMRRECPRTCGYC